LFVPLAFSKLFPKNYLTYNWLKEYFVEMKFLWK
jgi:hypothetical protein